MKTFRRIFALALLSMAFSAIAAEVDLDTARQFAKAWRGKGVKTARTQRSEAGESRFHVVSFEGGGWAAVGVDDTEAPVIAFSDNGEDLVEDERNAVWFLVKRDAERRAKGREGSHKEHKGHRGKHKGWERKRRGVGEGEGSGVKTATVKTGASMTALDDVRVAPLVQSTWNQLTADNYADGPLCYNYYTPNNYVCGCVATMMAQMMRYFEWPKASVAAKTYPCYVGTTIPNKITDSELSDTTMIGGTYNWSKMTLSPNASTLESNCQEIGKLCYDAGVSVSMMWSSVGSGAYTSLVREALVDTFGYANAHLVIYDCATEKNPVPFHPYDFEELKTIVISNCEAGLPVGYGISGAKAGGHAVVIDGYGYSDSGEFYMHINPGWSGDANAWYNPPNLSMGGYAFDSSDELVYNVFPEGSGALVTGRVVDGKGAPVADATVSGYLVYEEAVSVPMFGGWSQTRYYTRTNELASVRTDANGKYHFKTGLTGVASTLHATASNAKVSQTKTTDLLAAQTMLGSRESPARGIYSPNGYSLGNKIDFDFVLPKPLPPRIIFL